MMSNTRLDNFNNFIHDENCSGYVTMKVDSRFSNRFNGLPEDLQYAELRIAITPERSNLLKAAEALKTIYHDYGFGWKILTISEENQGQFFQSSQWDSAVMDEHAFFMPSNRQQLGKEICIYIHSAYGQDDQSQTSDWWKKVILKSWQVLEKNNVDFGDALPPIGDQALKTEGFITPFSFTRGIKYAALNAEGAMQNYRHKILLSEPFDQQNAVEDVYLTCDDLIEYNLQDSPNTICERRAEFYRDKERHDRLLAIIHYHLTEVEALEGNIMDLASASEDLDEATFNKIFECLPRDTRSDTLSVDIVRDLAGFNQNKEIILKEMALLEDEYKKHIDLSLLQINEERLKALIGKNPAMMQLLFRKMVIIQDEMAKINGLTPYFSLERAPASFDKLKLYQLNHHIKTLELNDASIEAQACKCLQDSLFEIFEKMQTTTPAQFASELISILEKKQFIHGERSFNALKIAAHSHSMKQVLLNIVACVLTLGYGLVNGLKNYIQRGQFDTEIEFFKSKTSAIATVASKIRDVAAILESKNNSQLLIVEDSSDEESDEEAIRLI